MKEKGIAKLCRSFLCIQIFLSYQFSSSFLSRSHSLSISYTRNNYRAVVNIRTFRVQFSPRPAPSSIRPLRSLRNPFVPNLKIPIYLINLLHSSIAFTYPFTQSPHQIQLENEKIMVFLFKSSQNENVTNPNGHGLRY